MDGWFSLLTVEATNEAVILVLDQEAPKLAMTNIRGAECRLDSQLVFGNMNHES